MTIKKKENLKLFYLLSFTWGILWTILGAFIFLGLKLWFRSSLKTFKYRGRIAAKIDNVHWGVSLGIFIIGHNEYTLNHEVGHTIQNAWFGPLFPFIVAIPSGIRFQLFDWLSARHYKKHNKYLGYDDIWFEAQATALGNKYR